MVLQVISVLHVYLFLLWFGIWSFAILYTVSEHHTVSLLLLYYNPVQVVESVRVPIKYKDLDDGRDKFTMEDWPIIDPHSITCYLFDSAGLQIPECALSKFWNHHASHGVPWAQHVDVKTIPVGIYGDSARVATKFGHINLVGIYYNLVLWKPASVRASRFLVTVIREDQLWKDFTLNTIYRRITWSLNSLIDGVHPSKGPYNEQLPPHLQKLAGQTMSNKCALVEIRGDWSWHKKVFRFSKGCSWNGLNVCHHCPAKSASDNPAELYWSLDQNVWEANTFTLDEFINERMPARHMCSWFDINFIIIFIVSIWFILLCYVRSISIYFVHMLDQAVIFLLVRNLMRKLFVACLAKKNLQKIYTCPIPASKAPSWGWRDFIHHAFAGA